MSQTASLGLVADGEAAAASAGFPTSGPSARSADRSRWPLVLISVVPLALVIGILGSLLLSAAPTGSTGPGSGAAQAPSPSAPVAQSASVSLAPSGSPSPVPTPAPTVDPALRALDELDAAIAAARGGPDGLKGKDANELAERVAVVRRDLAANDRAKALRDARDLDRRVRDRARRLDEQTAKALTDASTALVTALGG
jgi:hypothetical protein